MAVLLVCWQFGDWLFSFYDLVLGEEPPFPGIADIFYTAGYCSLLVSIPLLAYPRRPTGSLRWIVDALLLTTVAGFFQWELILAPIIQQVDGGLGVALLALSYSLWDLGLIAIIVGGVLARQGNLPLRSGILLASITCLAFTDMVYSYTVVTLGYDNVGNPLEVGWLASYLLIGIAATLSGREDTERANRRVPFYAFVFPYLLALTLPVVQVVRSITREEIDVLSLGGALVLLIAFLSHVRTSYLTMRALDEERRKARFDSLTGVLSRGAIVEEAQALLERDSDGFLLGLIDLDGLKAINDRFGHPAGDRALQVIADRLKLTGGLVGRYGGDEFLLILERGVSSSEGTAESMIADALEQAALPRSVADELRLSASIGVAMYPDQGGDFATLLKVADEAMYRQKRWKALTPGRGVRRMA